MIHRLFSPNHFDATSEDIPAMTQIDNFNKLRELNQKAEAGGGEERARRQHEQGKLLARERLDILLDSGSFVELDRLRTHHCTDFGLDKQKYLGDAVVCGYGAIDGRLVYVYSQDFTVFGGSLSRVVADKICKVLDMAVKNGAPLIGINDSGGARIQEGVDSLAGYGEIFQRNVMASGVVPQITAIMGPCAGGAVYSPAITDFIFMLKTNSYMFITGPDVIKTVTHEEVTKESLGGAETHAGKSGVAHFTVQSEKDCLRMIRELMGFLPSNNQEDAPFRTTTDDPLRRDKRLKDLVPDNPNRPYDMKDLISLIVDEGYFFEVQPEFARNILVGFAHLGGRSVGIVANQPAHLFGHQRLGQGGALHPLLRLLQYSGRDLCRCARFSSRYRTGIPRHHPPRRKAALRLRRGDRAESHDRHAQGLRRRLYRHVEQTFAR